MHQTLYRKWRPRTFDEVSGQDVITSVLKYEIANRRTAHAYLFCGSRGTGKTSCAKIFAKAVNCLDPRDGNPCGECESCRAVAAEATTDIIEMDAASNNGVDYIRDIRDSVVYAPAMLKYKVFIIDEVHMLSQQAFNALLKTLEEPPENVIFILATTEVNKLPVTVVSRCQRFDFSRISIDDISARLDVIAKAENISLDDRAARLIARLARGGMRDAVSLLELCAGDNRPVDVSRVNEAAGICPRDSVEKTFRAVADCDRAAIFDAIGAIYSSSLDLTEFWQQLIEYCRDLMVVKVNKNAGKFLELSDDEITSLREVADGISFDRLALYAGMLDDALTNLQKGIYDNRVLAEMTLIRMSSRHPGTDAASLAARIGELEEKFARLESAGPAPSSPDKKTKKTAEKKEETKPAAEENNAAQEDLTSEIPAPDGEKTEARAVSNWIDAVEQIKAQNNSIAAFLVGSEAVFDPGKNTLGVMVSGDFARVILDNESSVKAIADAAAKAGVCAPGATVVLSTLAPKKKEKDPFDEILG